MLRMERSLRVAHISHFEKATEMLSDEHRVIERVLAVLENLTTNPWRTR